MPGLKSLLNKSLRKNKITLSELNQKKNAKLKSEILEDLMHLAVIESKTYSKKNNPMVGKSLSLIRDTGVKFSNKEGRKLFNERTEKKHPASEVTRLKSNYRANPDNIPYLETTTVKGGFLYTSRVYLKSYDRSENKERIPSRSKTGKVYRLSDDKKYYKTAKFAFWSDVNLRKSEAIAIFRDIFTGADDSDLVNEYVLSTSNVNDTNFNLYEPVAFVFTGILRT